LSEQQRIAVTGGAGVIGTRLVERLRKAGAAVWVGDLKPRPPSFDSGVTYRQGDLNDLAPGELAKFSPDVVIHLAATFERSFETPEFWAENYRHNVQLSHHVCDAFAATRARTLIFASSYLVYDPRLYLYDTAQTGARPLVETDVVDPRNLCGAAKYFHEHELHFLSRAHPDRHFINARIFRGYGRGSRDVISRWVRDLLLDRPIDVYRSEGMFDFIYADDSAEGLLRLVGVHGNHTVNVATGRARRVSEVIDVLRQHFPRMRTQEKPSDIGYEASQADISRLEALTSWRPAFALETAIPQIIDYERARLSQPEAAAGQGAPVAARAASAILVTSASRKVPLIQSVRAAAVRAGLDARIIGADVNAEAIARSFVDGFWVMPKLSQLDAGSLLDYCRANGIGYIVPTRDGELEFFAAARATLADGGVAVMISPPDTVHNCIDKLAFCETLTGFGFPAIPTSTSIDAIAAPRLVLKERFGAGSQGLHLDIAPADARAKAGSLSAPIFQPFIAGVEYSADVYVDRGGSAHGVVVRRRDVVLGGESQVTTTVRHARAESLCAAIAAKLGIYGHCVFQLIEDERGQLHIIECNARFGGASTLSVAAGLDSFCWFLLESRAQTLGSAPFVRAPRELRQVRYACDRVEELETK
jgi:carbamoyl-phosphate synthase large subunit